MSSHRMLYTRTSWYGTTPTATSVPSRVLPRVLCPRPTCWMWYSTRTVRPRTFLRCRTRLSSSARPRLASMLPTAATLHTCRPNTARILQATTRSPMEAMASSRTLWPTATPLRPCSWSTTPAFLLALSPSGSRLTKAAARASSLPTTRATTR